MPRVSVIIPSYNRAGMLPRTVRSVLGQTLPDLECIVVDDGSTDDTRQVIAGISDPRLRYIWQENQERSAARNTGIAASRGASLIFLDSDDHLLPGALELLSPVLDAQPDAGMASTGWQDVNEGGEITAEHGPWAHPRQPSLQDWLFGNLTRLGACLVRREWILQVGGFDLRAVPVEDTHLWVKLAAASCPVEWVPGLSVQRLRHAGSTVSSAERMRTGHLGLVDLLFADPLIAKRFDLTRAAIQGRVLVGSACAYLAAGNFPAGQEDFRQAIRSDPDLLIAGQERVLSLIVGQGRVSNPTQPWEFVARVFDHLPAEAGTLLGLRRKALGQAYLAEVFRAHRRGDLTRARWALLKGLPYNPAWLKNKGVVSIGLQSLLGKDILQALRQKVKPRSP